MAVPGRVSRIADELSHSLSTFDNIQSRHSIVVKRLGRGRAAPLGDRARRALAGAPAVEARITGIGVFEDPPTGSAPVVYLDVESPGLRRIHEDLCTSFEPVPGLEAEGYVPHVTLARGGSFDDAYRLAERSVEPVTWTVSELGLWDAEAHETVRRFPLPA